MKKLILCLIFITTTLLFSQGIIPEGAGTTENPYLVSTLDNLLYISEHEQMWNNKHYRQTNDIDATETAEWNDGQGFNGFGYVEEVEDPLHPGSCDEIYHHFDSNYNGDGHPISNFKSSGELPGFVSILGSHSLVENLIFIDPYVTGSYYVGVVASINKGTVSNCIVINGYVEGDTGVGLIAGTIQPNWNTTSHIINCDVSGEVVGEDKVGGVVGSCHMSEVSNCSAIVSVSSVGENYGGIIGIGTDNYNQEHCYSVINSYYNIDESTIGDNDYVTIGGVTNAIYENWLSNDKTLDLNDYLNTNQDSYLLSSPSDFEFVRAAYYLPSTFEITSDIDFASSPNFNIPNTKSSFDGNNHTLYNINIVSNKSYSAFIGLFEGEYVRNINIENGLVEGNKYTAILIGENSGLISNCHVSGTVTGTSYVGGLIGMSLTSYEDAVSSCSSNVTISGTYKVGGLLGMGCAIDCTSISDVSGSISVGGLIGYGGASNCYSESTAEARYEVGGLVGKGFATNSNSTGNIIGEKGVGGLIGELKCQISFYDYDHYNYHITLPLELENNSSDCSVVGENRVSGLISTLNDEDGHIILENSYSSGDVTITTYDSYLIQRAAGIISSVEGELDIINCYSTSNIIIEPDEIDDWSSFSGLVGYSLNSISVVNSFWSEELSNVSTNNGGSNVTQVELQNIDTFLNAGWDFETVWAINSEINNGYPYLLIEDDFTPNSDEETAPELQARTILKDSYPNPFNPETTIEFYVESRDQASLTIYNVKGQVVKDYDTFDAGEHKVVWQGKNNNNKQVSSGLYLYRLKGQKSSLTKKMILMK